MMITKMGPEDKQKLIDAKVGIAGAGGLGSNCAMFLARAGVGHLVILDFDRVEEPNLNRQHFSLDQVGELKTEALKANIEEAISGCKVEVINEKYVPGDAKRFFGHCQVIVEAFDAAETKASLIQDALSNIPEIRVVSGSGIAGIGGNNLLQTKQKGRLFMVGDGKTQAKETVPLLAPRVAAVAAMQANAVLSILLEDPEVVD